LTAPVAAVARPQFAARARRRLKPGGGNAGADQVGGRPGSRRADDLDV
jgi:hypothetical protein